MSVMMYVGFEVLTAVVMKRSPLKVNQNFGRTYHFHFHGQRIKIPAWKQVASTAYFHTDILIGLFFDPEDGGDMFL
jgi:hypothetical protein